jgi:DNA-binding GntR family transcriptional regulator
VTQSSGSRATYLVVADRLHERIATGEFAPGSKLPAVKDLAAQYGVAPNTVGSAIRHLRDQGLVYTQQGRGTYVQSGVAEALGAIASPEFRELSAKIDDVMRSLQDLDERVIELERVSQSPREERSHD